MAVYRLNLVESLARQLPFAPHEVRIAQLAAAESLLNDLDVGRTYRPDEVVFRVTGYRGRQQPAEGELTGLALQHDLCLMIEQVSDGLDLIAVDQVEPVLSIDDVVERFNVTSKTIQRWRKKGLVSRRFAFAGGKRRVGFLLSSIERFIERHGEVVRRSTANATLVGEVEVTAIVAAARHQVASHRLAEQELTRRLARRFKRSTLTILHTLRRHDQADPAAAVLSSAAKPTSTARRQRIVAAARRGVPLTTIARRSRRSMAAVYQIVLDDRVERLISRRVRFHDDELYHARDADRAIAAMVHAADASTGGTADVCVPRGLPPYLADLYRTPLLSPAQERALCLAFHYRKFRFVVERRRLDPESARHRDVRELEAAWRDVVAVKNRIVNANLRLVVSVARKHLRPAAMGGAGSTPSLMELVSEGNLILMRAAESFDVHKNVRFSTYATLALMRGFARLVPELQAKAAGTARSALVANVPDARSLADRERHADRDEVRTLLDRLSRDERTVIDACYGLDAGASGSARTFDDVGRLLGVSKRCVRQIERGALDKLRAVVKP